MKPLPTIDIPSNFASTLIFRPDFGGHQYFTADKDMRALLYLASLCSGPILEMGCNHGVATFNIAIRYPKRCVKAVDWSGGNTMVPEQKGEQPAKAECIGECAKWLPNVIVIDRNLQEITPSELGSCDFVFIDADHSEDAVRRNTKLAMELSPSVIAWHDYKTEDERPWIGVAQVLEELRIQGISATQVNDTMVAYALLR